MSIGSITKGISIGITAGTIAYAVANSTSREKRRIKSDAGKALHAIGDMIEGFNAMMK